MKFVKFYYVDAVDSIPSFIAPLRNGYKVPSPDLTIDSIDYRGESPVIWGNAPDEFECDGQVVLEVSDFDHQNAISDIKAKEEEFKLYQSQKKNDAVAESRRQLYAISVDRLVIESVIKRRQGNDVEADALIDKAISERNGIQSNLPWVEI